MTSSFKSAGRCVGKLSNQIRRRLDSLALKGQFSGAQGRALHFILAQTGDVFQKDLEEEFSLRPPTATELLKQMEKNGLVRRESLDSDRRMKKIILTEKALEYQEQVKDGLMELEEDLVKGIPEEKLEIFLTASAALRRERPSFACPPRAPPKSPAPDCRPRTAA